MSKYEEEKKRGLPLSDHFKDIHTTKGYLVSEIRFSDLILLPLVEVINEYAKNNRMKHVIEMVGEGRDNLSKRLEEINKEEGGGEVEMGENSSQKHE